MKRTTAMLGAAHAAALLLSASASQATTYHICKQPNGPTKLSDVLCADDPVQATPRGDASLAARVVDGLAGAQPSPVASQVDDAAVAGLAQSLVKALDPTQPAWNPSNPRWVVMTKVVSSDIHGDTAPFREALRRRTHAILVQTLSAHLGNDELNQLLEFMHSGAGQHYWEFQGRIAELQGASPRLSNPAGAAVVPPDLLKTRARLLAMSSTSQLLQSLSGSAAGQPADPSGLDVYALIARGIIARAGPQLDELGQRYSSDLDAFETFNRSTLARHFYGAYAAALPTLAQTLTAGLAYFRTTEQARYGARWQMTYSGALTSVAGLQIESSTPVDLPTPQNPYRRYDTVAAAAPDGGFLIVRGLDQTHMAAVRMNPAGGVLWRKTLESATPEFAKHVLATPGGAFQLFGLAYTRDVANGMQGSHRWLDVLNSVQYDYARAIGASGKELPADPLSPVGFRLPPQCVAEVPDGFILTRWVDGGPRYSNELVPSIEKVSKSGRQLWEHILAEEGGQEVIYVMGVETTECRGLSVAAHGRITWAMPVALVPLASSMQNFQQNQMNQGVLATLLVQFDAQGHERHRIIRPLAANALLLDGPKGFTLLEFTVSPSPDRLLHYQGLRLSSLDFDLKETTPSRVVATGDLTSLHAARRTPSGGLLLAGCPITGGNSYLLYVSPSFSTSPLREYNAGGAQQCSSVIFSAGESGPRRLRVLIYNDLRGVGLLTVRYTD